jgi:hypothetical protein
VEVGQEGGQEARPILQGQLQEVHHHVLIRGF